MRREGGLGFAMADTKTDFRPLSQLSHLALWRLLLFRLSLLARATENIVAESPIVSLSVQALVYLISSVNCLLTFLCLQWYCFLHSEIDPSTVVTIPAASVG